MTITYKDNTLEQVPATSTRVGGDIGAVQYARIIYATVHNESAANVALVINVVQSGETASITNQYLSTTIAAGDTVSLFKLVGRVLESGDGVYATAGTANALNLSVGVKEVTT